jgi:hypothetical protein
MTHKNRKKLRILFFKLQDEGFSCTVGVLYGGLEISKFAIFYIFGHLTLDPDKQLEKMQDPDAH